MARISSPDLDRASRRRAGSYARAPERTATSKVGVRSRACAACFRRRSGPGATTYWRRLSDPAWFYRLTLRVRPLRGGVLPHHGTVQGDGSPVDEPDAANAGAAPTWFDVVRDVGDQLVPRRADWVVLHVRECVIQLVRDRSSASLAQAGIGQAVPGEQLRLVVLRHRDGDLEVTLRNVVDELSPRVGDPYGAGRVTWTGVCRMAPVVDHAHLRAIATDEHNLHMLEQLNLGGAVVAAVVASGVVIGALSVAHAPGSAIPFDDRWVAQDFGRTIGAALDASRPATAQQTAPVRPMRAEMRWSPPTLDNPVAAARRWVRCSLPELLQRPVRTGLGDDLDLVVSELASNAIRHSGALGGIRLGVEDNVVRVAVFDPDDRPPTLRTPTPDSDSGRGLQLVTALSAHWWVDHDVEHGGKVVWAALKL